MARHSGTRPSFNSCPSRTCTREPPRPNSPLQRVQEYGKFLLRHAQNALEAKWIEPLINEDTGLIEDDLPTLLAYLDANYGVVQSEEVKQKESEVLSTSFNPSEPLIVLFRPIEQLQKLATAANIPYSLEQQLEIGLTIIRSTRDFEKALGDWNEMAVASKTWDSFKSHFTQAQSALKAIRGPTMQQAGYHHANMLAAQLRADLQVQGSEMLAMVQDMSVRDDIPPTDSRSPPEPAVNASVGDSVQLEMLRLLRQIAGNRQGGSGPSNRDSAGSGDASGGRRRTRKTPDNASFPRDQTSLYCWTHGACNHLSKDCERKALGHKDTAKLANRMGGSNAFCQTGDE